MKLSSVIRTTVLAGSLVALTVFGNTVSSLQADIEGPREEFRYLQADIEGPREEFRYLQADIEGPREEIIPGTAQG